MSHKCSKCGKVFTRKYNRDKHYKNRHQESVLFFKKGHTCPFCQQNGIYTHFKDRKVFVKHIDQEHLDSLIYKLKKSAFDGKITVFSKPLITLQLLENFISDKKNLEEILKVILVQISKFQVVKVALIVTAEYRIPSNTEDSSDKNGDDNDSNSLAEERDRFSLRTKRLIFNVNESLATAKKKVRDLLKSLLDREQDLLMRGSGWQFESLHSCDIEIVSHNII